MPRFWQWWGSCKSVAARRKDSGESVPSVDKITSLTRRTWSNSSFGVRHFHKSFFALFLGAVSALFSVWFYYDQLTALLVESTSLDLSSVCLYWWRALLTWIVEHHARASSFTWILDLHCHDCVAALGSLHFLCVFLSDITCTCSVWSFFDRLCASFGPFRN